MHPILVVVNVEEEGVQDIIQRSEVVVHWLTSEFLKGSGHSGKESGNFLQHHDG